MNPSKLLYIDRLLFWPNKGLNVLYFGVRKLIPTRKSTNSKVLVLKLAGMGSLIKLASVFQNNGVDFSKVILCTFEQNREIAEMLGFQNVIFLSPNFFGLLKKCIVLPFKYAYSFVYDAERNVNATSILKKYLSIFGSAKSIGYTDKEDFKTTHDFQFSMKERNHTDLFKVVLPFFDTRKGRLESDSSKRKLPEAKILININASDYLSARRFPKEKYGQVIERISKLYPQYKIVLTGAKSEMQYVSSLEKVLTRKNLSVSNACGNWSLQQLKQELLTTSVFITNDSGPMHLAIWLNTPTVSIWGPTQHKYSGYSENNRIKNVSLNLPCSPCFLNSQSKWGSECKRTISCMNDLGTDPIMKAVSQIIPVTS